MCALLFSCKLTQYSALCYVYALFFPWRDSPVDVHFLLRRCNCLSLIWRMVVSLGRIIVFFFRHLDLSTSSLSSGPAMRAENVFILYVLMAMAHRCPYIECDRMMQESRGWRPHAHTHCDAAFRRSFIQLFGWNRNIALYQSFCLTASPFFLSFFTASSCWQFNWWCRLTQQ